MRWYMYQRKMEISDTYITLKIGQMLVGKFVSQPKLTVKNQWNDNIYYYHSDIFHITNGRLAHLNKSI